MKILFIVDFLSSSHFGREPLGVLYLISVLKREGLCADLIDISELKKNSKKIGNFQPDIIGYSVKTGYHREFMNLNKELKKIFKFVSIFGGPHATFCPEIIYEEGIDVVCRGEAEGTIINFIHNIDNGGYVNTAGFWVKQDEKIFKNDLGKLIENLDNIPFPDRAVLEKYPFFKHFCMRNFISGRGCFYKCTYCHNHALQKLYNENRMAYIRRRSVENLIEEIMREARKNELRFINFEDDIFVQDKRWLQQFSMVYPRVIHLPFHCHVRVDMLDEESIFLLKSAGCHSVSLGMETADETLREKILYRKMSNELFLNICSMLKSYKINVALQNMLGIPHTEIDDDLATLKLNIKCKADYSITSMFTPYPGTKIAEMYPFKDWGKIGNYYHSSVYAIKNKQERENLQKIFALIVKMPFLLGITSFMVKLPFRKIYNYIGLFWKYFWGRKKIFPTGFDNLSYSISYIIKFFIRNQYSN